MPPSVFARAQEELSAIDRAFDQIAREAQDSGQVADTPLARLAPSLREVQGELRWLKRRAARWKPGPAVDEFVAALHEHRQLLEEVRRSSGDDPWRVLEAVIRDIAIKARQCRLFGGPRPVEVSVVTRDAGNLEVTGYEVWFVRKAYERKPQAFRRFDRNSSPAGRVFREAGYYVLWAQQPGTSGQAQRGTPLDVEVGPERSEQVVDLFAPTVLAKPTRQRTAGEAPAPGQ